MNSATRIFLGSLFGIIAVLGSAVTAQAHGASPVEFTYHWSTGSNGIVVEEVGHVSKRWALTSVVHDWNSGSVLNIHLGRCSHFPTQHCVQVGEYDQKDSGPAGYTVIVSDSETPTVINLNKGYWNWSTVDSHAVTCHEFGHAVGFSHDERSGCTSEVNRETASKWQLAYAARAYLAAK